MTSITVKETKNQSFFTLFIDDEQSIFSHCGSRKLTNTCNENGDGIFNHEVSLVKFKREDTWVTVDFGTVWDITSYSDPAQEIKRRIQLVEEAFEAVSEGYEKVWTVNLDDDNEYIEKRKEEAASATFYFDGDDTYRMNWVSEETFCFENEDNGEEYVQEYSVIPQEAYFLKLVRID